MPQTYREYPVYELALVTYSNARVDDGMIRYQAGDIVVVRPALDGIGLMEMKDFLWLRIQGWDSALMDRLADEITDKSQSDPLYVDDSIGEPIIYEKARYCIPFETISRVMPGFSVERATDANDAYQPFMVIDEGNADDDLDKGLFLSCHPPIDPDGLILDKFTQRYLYA